MRSRRLKIITAVVVTGIALLALTPIVGAAAAKGFGPGDGSGPITGASFGPAGFANRAGQANAASDMTGMQAGRQYSLVAVAATQLKMDQTDLVAELRAGKTIAQVAKEHNVATNTIVDAFVATRADLLKAQVADGHLTQAQADSMLATIRTHATEQINEPWTQWGGAEGAGMRLHDGSCDHSGAGLGPQAGR